MLVAPGKSLRQWSGCCQQMFRGKILHELPAPSYCWWECSSICWGCESDPQGTCVIWKPMWCIYVNHWCVSINAFLCLWEVSWHYPVSQGGFQGTQSAPTPRQGYCFSGASLITSAILCVFTPGIYVEKFNLAASCESSQKASLKHLLWGLISRDSKERAKTSCFSSQHQ